MKLIIQKDQAKKLLGGISFELRAKVELDQNESSLVSKYKADKTILMSKSLRIPFTDKTIPLEITIGSLVSGQVFSSSDIGEILETEKIVIEACENFKNYIEVMNSFGGEEIHEF